MSNNIRIKRRASSGSAGAPSSLANAEIAFNEADDTLYYGKGTDGAGGTATSVIPIGGPGAFAQKHSPTFTGIPAAPTATADTKSTQIATTDFVISQAGTGTPLMAGTATSGTSKRYSREDHKHPTDNTRAPLASPVFTGTPTAPTPTNATNNAQLATTAFVKAVIGDLINGADTALDTLAELAAALGNDPDFAATITATLGGKLAKSSNLSDLTNTATARGNLGLNSMALQSSGSVSISGGTINGIVFDGGTF